MLERNITSPEIDFRDQNATEMFLQTAWSSALRGRAAPADKPYWELGVNSNRALQILRYIWLQTGLDLPVNLFVEAPTIRKMAARLRDGTASQTQDLLRMGGGDDHPALFLFAGGAGFLHELTDLVRALDIPGAIYGVTASGPEASEPPIRDHYAEAARASALIRDAQPYGPYHIAGYSLGGCTALETARHLRETGEDVRLMILDASLNDHCWPVLVWLSYMAPKFADRVIGRLKRKLFKRTGTAKPGLPDIAPVQRGTMFEFRFRNPRHPDYCYYSPHWQSYHPPNYTEMRARAIVMRGIYRPALYDGPVTFFVSLGGDPASCSPIKIWPRYLPNAQWKTISGNHTNMIMGRHAKHLAAEMAKQLK